jgi:hypothetical protein
MCLYGTEAESSEADDIARRLPSCHIVNPGILQRQADESVDAMRYFFKVVEYCDALVFSRLLGEISAGVGLEVNHALAKSIPVYELFDGSVFRVSRPVSFLSRDETLKRYVLWRNSPRLGQLNTRKE